MKTTTLLCSCLCLLLLRPAGAGVPESPAEAEAALRLAQQRYERALVSYGEVLAAERELLACRMAGEETPAADLLPQLDSLCRRYGEYLKQELAGGLADKAAVSAERIRLQKLRLELEHRTGKTADGTALIAEAEAALARAQRNCASGLANHGEVLVAERELLACRMAVPGCVVDELLPPADSLCRRSEEYLTRCLEGGVADRLSINGELIRCLSLKLELERRAGRPVGGTRARLRALYEANVEVCERRFRSGQVSAAELESARRALADFSVTE